MFTVRDVVIDKSESSCQEKVKGCGNKWKYSPAKYMCESTVCGC